MENYDFNAMRTNLKILRERKKYSRYDLSIASDIHYQYYCAIESGHKIPNFKTLISIANALNTDLSSLFKTNMSPDEIQLKLKRKLLHELISLQDRTILYKYNEFLNAYLHRNGSVANGIQSENSDFKNSSI